MKWINVLLLSIFFTGICTWVFGACCVIYVAFDSFLDDGIPEYVDSVEIEFNSGVHCEEIRCIMDSEDLESFLKVGRIISCDLIKCEGVI